MENKEYERLEKYISIRTLISMLSAKTKLTIWRTETEKLFDGCVYQLYDNSNFNDLYITYLQMDILSGVTVIAMEK